MPRPPAVQSDAIVDAEVCARSAALIERRFTGSELPRLTEASGSAGSALNARLQFSQVDGLPAVDGRLSGAIVAVCQRCMKPVSIGLDEVFRVVIVKEDRADEPGGYEPVIADTARLDLRWLADEQALLAMPLVPLHESETCARVAAPAATPDAAADESVRHKPFENLRDLLHKQ